MTKGDLFLILHELLCFAVFYSVFYRAVRSCAMVRMDIRFSFFSLGVVSAGGMVAPLAFGFVPSIFTLSMMAAVALVETVTAHHWAKGAPPRFCKPIGQQKHRSIDVEQGWLS